MTQGMKAAIAALDVFAVTTQLEDKHFDELSAHVGKSSSTYGILWGLEVGGTPDALDLLEIMGEVNTFLRELKQDLRFKMAARAVIAKLADGETEMPNYLVNQFKEED